MACSPMYVIDAKKEVSCFTYVLYSKDDSGWWAWSTKNLPKIILGNCSQPLDSIGQA